MTALNEYERLETTGLWRETPDSQRREVAVSLGDATLVISSMTDSALSHWSLPAVTRLNPGNRPALYAPDGDSGELLEISEPDMIAAIERVRSAIERRRPHPGRLRLYLGVASALLIVLICVLWVPGALKNQAAAVMPPAARADIGERILAEMADLSGRPCADNNGVAALRGFSATLFGSNAPQIIVLPSTAQVTAHLPGNILVVNRALVEDHEDPEVLAGFLLAEDLRRSQLDPMRRLLDEAGLMATLRLLTTAEMRQEHLRSHATGLLTTPPSALEISALLDRFATASVSSEPYAFALDLSGETVLPLVEGDPMRNRLRSPLISDQNWIALQEICGG